MRKIVLLLALACGSCYADDMIARRAGDEIRLSDKPCANAGILSMLPPAEHETFHVATATLRGKSFDACWQADDDGNVRLIYADGDQGIIPMSAFKRAPST